MGNTEKITPYYIPMKKFPYYEEDTTLVFESRFESGNLDLAVKLSEN